MGLVVAPEAVSTVSITLIEPRFELVNVQVMFSPAPTLIVAVAVARLPVLLLVGSTQLMAVVHP